MMIACAALIAASCSPGSSTTSEPSDEPAESAATSEPSDEPAESAEPSEPSSEPAETAEPQQARPELTSDAVQLKVLMETGGGAFDLLELLGEEFSRQFPNVTFEYQKDSFDNLLINGPRLLASDNPPDVLYLPQLIDPARDGLLRGLDEYSEQFGWDAFSPSQLAQNRVNDQGIRGSGTLYGVGAGYSITGVMYNKELAAQIGMDEPPATLDEFESLMAKAKANDILPIISNTPATFAHQMIFNQYVDPEEIANFVYLVPGARIDTPEAIAAAERLERWAKEGYFNEDVNSLGYFDLMSRFIDGEGLFMFNGSWASAELDEAMPGNAGFFAVPPLVEGDPPVAMGASYTIVIPARSSHSDVVAFFYDWIHTNPIARQIISDTNGMSPGGPPDLPPPDAEPGSLVEQMQEQGAYLVTEGVIVDYLGNATSGFFTSTLIPEVQRLVGGQTNPEDFSRALQKGYEDSITQ